jgi:hypothetical protein
MSLEWSTSMTEVDGLSLIPTDLYVSALTPRLYWGKTVLQLSGNITFFAICCIYTRVIVKKGLVDPCGLGDMICIQTLQNTKHFRTTACVSRGVDIIFSTETLTLLLERNEITSLIMLAENSNLNNVYNKPDCHRVWKAFSIAKNTEVRFHGCRVRHVLTNNTSSVPSVPKLGATFDNALPRPQPGGWDSWPDDSWPFPVLSFLASPSIWCGAKKFSPVQGLASCG